jgi:thymidine kinase
MAGFIVYCGPMFSGKTTRFLNYLDRCHYQGKTTAVFKPEIDARYAHKEIVTHSGTAVPCKTIVNGNDIIEHLIDAKSSIDVVAVDEAFMVDGIAESLIFLYKHGKDIVVSTLDLSSGCEPFEEISSMLPYATIVKKCNAVCTVCGSDAQYTYKKVEDGNIISIGGSDKYEPRCWKHHPLMNKVDYE